MKNVISSGLVAVGVIAGFTAAASAQDAGANPAELFKQLDKDANGKLTRDEIGEDRRRFFDRVVRLGDKDKNGELSKEEFVSALGRRDRPVAGGAQRDRQPGGRGRNPAQFFKQLDRNKDGKLTLEELPDQMRQRFKPLFERLGKDSISQEEFAQAARRRPGQPNQPGGRPDGRRAEEFFKRLDQNGDGKVTLEEVPDRAKQIVEGLLRRARKEKGDSLSKEEFVKLMAQGQGSNGRPGNQGDRPRQGRGGFGVPRYLRILDTNKDGKLSKEELAKSAEKFAELDQNKDGSLDLRELMGFNPGGNRPGQGGRPGDRPRRPGESDRPRRPGGEDARRPDGARRPGAAGPEFAEQFFKRYDKNSDGKITKDEAPDRLKQGFSRFDSNDDGNIDLEELKRGFSRRPAGQDRPRRRPNDN